MTLGLLARKPSTGKASRKFPAFIGLTCLFRGKVSRRCGWRAASPTPTPCSRRCLNEGIHRTIGTAWLPRAGLIGPRRRSDKSSAYPTLGAEASRFGVDPIVRNERHRHFWGRRDTANLREPISTLRQLLTLFGRLDVNPRFSHIVPCLFRNTRPFPKGRARYYLSFVIWG